MKGIKIAVTVLMSLSLLFIIEAGFAQNQKVGKKDSAPQQPPQPQQEVKLVKIIKDCYVPYIDTEKLYAVVETSVVPSEEEGNDTGVNRGIGKGNPAVTDQKQTVQQKYQFTISPEVEVREQNEKGLQFTIETVAGVGFITKADIFVMKNKVIKIIILDMEL